MRLPKVLVALLMLGHSSGAVHARPSDGTAGPSLRFLPGRVVVPPLVASPQEPRVGVRKEIGASRLKLDIGSIVDLLELAWHGDSSRVRLGAELFAHALTTNAQGLRLQVDALDGFFGGHLAALFQCGSSAIALRLRLLHLSAHMVDGHWSSDGAWLGGRRPIPFTRDFGELTLLWSIQPGRWQLRVYAGVSYAALVRPAAIRSAASHLGFEVSSPGVCGMLLGKPVNLYVADHLSVAGVPSYVGSNAVEAGAKLGDWEGTGLRFYVSFSSGLEEFSQYYDIQRSAWGAGFAIDFW